MFKVYSSERALISSMLEDFKSYDKGFHFFKCSKLSDGSVQVENPKEFETQLELKRLVWSQPFSVTYLYVLVLENFSNLTFRGQEYTQSYDNFFTKPIISFFWDESLKYSEYESSVTEEQLKDGIAAIKELFAKKASGNKD